MRVVLINAPWAADRLKNIREWWGLEFVFDVVELNVPVPMQKHPTVEGLAVLDMEFVNQNKKGFTLFVAPYEPHPRDRNGDLIEGRASVNGIFLPPALPFSRWEWFFTRLFWSLPVIEVFANETDHVYTNGKDIGNAFEVWTQHEFSHFLYSVVAKPDKTHDYFYSGTPEKARKEILAVFKTPFSISTPIKPLGKIHLGAEAIKEFEGWFPPSIKVPLGSVSYRNKNPGNLKNLSGKFIVYPTYEAGWNALIDYLTRACTGRHMAYKPEMSIRQFFSVYAPANDNNYPEKYAQFFASKIGVPVDTPIRELV